MMITERNILHAEKKKKKNEEKGVKESILQSVGKKHYSGESCLETE